MLRTLEMSLRSLAAHVRFYGAATKPLAPLMLILFGQHFVASGALAQATGTLGTVEDSADSVLATINAILRPVSIIAVIGLGLAASFGKMEWGLALKVFIGLVIANAATTIVDWVGGGAAQT